MACLTRPRYCTAGWCFRGKCCCYQQSTEGAAISISPTTAGLTADKHDNPQMYVNTRSSSPYRCAITAPSLQRAVVEQHSSYHRFIYGPVLLRCGENLKLFKSANALEIEKQTCLLHQKRNKPACNCSVPPPAFFRRWLRSHSH
jgi:hypothetical protein